MRQAVPSAALPVTIWWNFAGLISAAPGEVWLGIPARGGAVGTGVQVP
jgi:hypothetical protein